MEQRPGQRNMGPYVAGSAARKVESAPQPLRRPRHRRQPVWVIQVDPLALAGIVMAAVMAILMLTGVCRLIHSRRMAARAEETVRALTAENEALRRRYEEGCDLAEIAAEAERLGLVPEEQVPHIDLSGS